MCDAYSPPLLCNRPPSPLPGTPQPCPCWSQSELNGVTKDNVFDPGSSSCAYNKSVRVYMDQTVIGISSGSNQGFVAGLTGTAGFCASADCPNTLTLTEEQAESCIQQIKDRCAEINHPVPSATSANQGEMTTFDQQVSVAQGKNTMASNSSSALSLLLSGAVVTVATYLITMVI